MYWWIILGVCIVVGVIGVIMYNKHKYTKSSSVGCGMAVVAFILVFLIGLLGITLSLVDARDMNQFKEQKQYIETHVVKDSVENAALTTEKIKQNKWLYTAQWSINNFNGWNFYPNEVKDLKPIQ